jgi:DNA-binding FrmR family transcriptional regulator
MNDDRKKTLAARLGRIEGQVRGVARMIEEDRYCIDVLTQVQAIKAALHKVEEEVLRDHVHHCVGRAFEAGDPADKQQKVEELVSVVSRLMR